MSKDGFFLVLEGIDGSGTTTIGKMLESELKSKRIKSHYTFEPTYGPIGSVIKNILSRRVVMNTTRKGEVFDQKSLALLFAADRIDHIRNEIEPLLSMGYIIICDRYKYSSYAYQSLFVSEGWIREINTYAIEPDLLIFLDVDVDIGLKRVGARGGVKEIYERRGLLKRVRSNYLNFITKVKFAKIVNANKALDDVYLEVRDILFRRLLKYGYKI
ncbi:MAG: dTMP kinase [Deltaproteobacteria bacterium]|nr:dTMP kinase [Deltaproteobacteria bacterium]